MQEGKMKGLGKVALLLSNQDNVLCASEAWGLSKIHYATTIQHSRLDFSSVLNLNVITSLQTHRHILGNGSRTACDFGLTWVGGVGCLN